MFKTKAWTIIEGRVVEVEGTVHGLGETEMLRTEEGLLPRKEWWWNKTGALQEEVRRRTIEIQRLEQKIAAIRNRPYE